eukprot:TRINITY_DN2728_c0_g1_i2.p1 TRINITY_DN2728_c0_g1~~TRINITY_DN2728_c0_g1_i2.p1  ORF type:complete len:196 (-),score=29.72 TRINITY_DN2728_c0_g1_i2:28-615(-)
MDTYDFLFKIIVLGGSGVGKSSILLRFCDGTFGENRTTIFDFKMHKLQLLKTKIKLQIWDTGSQERFKFLPRGYYQGAQGIIMCFDLTNPDWCSSVEVWLNEIRNNQAENATVILVGTKSDLHNQRVVQAEDALAFASKHNMQYIETSAKEGTNVNQLFETLTSLVYRNLVIPSEQQQITPVQGSQKKSKECLIC